MSTVGKTITCKAAVVWEANGKFVVENVEVAPPQENEVRIKLVAAGVCHSDIHAVQGELGFWFPAILGHEGAGIVESIGKGVTTVKPGDKVLTVVFPHCRECRNCKFDGARTCKKKWLITKDGFEGAYRVMDDGNSRFTVKGQQACQFDGVSSFTEYTVSPEIHVAKIRDDAPLEKVCIYACAIPTGFGASVQVAQIKKGSNVAIWGLGGVGLCAVLGAKDAGAAKIIGVDVNPDKFKVAKQLGCTDVVNPLDISKPIAQVLSDLTDGNLDYAIVCIGVAKAMEDALKSVVIPGGTAVFVGIANGNLSIPGKDFLSGSRVLGCALGGFKFRDDVPKLVDRYMKGEINSDPIITHFYRLEQLNEAIALLSDAKCLRSVIRF